MLPLALTLFLTLGLFLASCSHVSSQDLLKTKILDGSWDLTRYHYSDTASSANTAESHCGKQEHITFKIENTSFVQEASIKDTMFGTSGIWEIQSLEAISGDTNCTLKPELEPLYLKFRAFKDAVNPLDLCVAVQVVAPSTSTSSDKGGRTELFGMVNATNPREWTAPWIQFGGACAQGVNFLMGKCVSGPCLDTVKYENATATHQGQGHEATKKNNGLSTGVFFKSSCALGLLAVVATLV